MGRAELGRQARPLFTARERGVPEYGGNRRGQGWRMVRFEGDSQPLGYLLYSRADGRYHERADHPLSGPNPDGVEAPRPLSAEADRFQLLFARALSAFEDVC